MKLDFVWKLTEDGFAKIRTDEQSPDVFGSVHVGMLLVEFRCAGGGYDDDYHPCICDTFLYGRYNESLDYFVNGVPYDMIEYDPVIPKRRSIDHFKSAFERSFEAFLGEHTDLIPYATSKTLVNEWN